MIRLQELEIGYRKRGAGPAPLLNAVNISAGASELIAVVGKNGSGKSTLLKTVSGLHQALHGDVLLNGKRLSEYHRREIARLVSFVSTEVVRVPGFRVSDMVSMGRYPYTNWFGRLDGEDHRQVDLALEQVGLIHLKHRNMDEISDGERQRAMIARTLAQDTPLIILDEPTAFLDLPNRHEVIHLLYRLSRERQKTIIYSTHDLHIALHEADRLWILYKDSLLDGAPEDLVLEGVISDAFLDDKLGMDMDTGNFVIKREFHTPVHISGDDSQLVRWTGYALERLGFHPVESQQAEIVIRTFSQPSGNRWLAENKSGEKEFTKIYDLSLYLRTL